MTMLTSIHDNANQQPWQCLPTTITLPINNHNMTNTNRHANTDKPFLEHRPAVKSIPNNNSISIPTSNHDNTNQLWLDNTDRPQWIYQLASIKETPNNNQEIATIIWNNNNNNSHKQIWEYQPATKSNQVISMSILTNTIIIPTNNQEMNISTNNNQYNTNTKP